jgi:cobalt/nickel transport system permease protein
MHEKVLARVEPPQAFLEHLDPRIKIVCTLVWAGCIVTIPERDTAAQVSFGLILLALLALNRRSCGKFIRRFGAALPLIVLLVALLPFFREGQVLRRFGLLEVTQEGLWSAQRVATSAILCVAALCLLWATTHEADLIGGLSGIGLPAIFVGVLACMLRYLHVLRPELHRLWDARAARTIGARSGGRFRSASNLLGAFFLRSHDRALRVADALAARGYDGQWRGAQCRRLTTLDALAAGVFVAGIILLRWSPWR